MSNEVEDKMMETHHSLRLHRLLRVDVYRHFPVRQQPPPVYSKLAILAADDFWVYQHIARANIPMHEFASFVCHGVRCVRTHQLGAPVPHTKGLTD